jgi:hypothetical protein
MSEGGVGVDVVSAEGLKLGINWLDLGVEVKVPKADGEEELDPTK